MSINLRFNAIYDKLKTTTCSTPILKDIKENYLAQINSPRRFDHINNVEELLKVLKKRDCLTIDCMQEISLNLNRQDVIDIIIQEKDLNPCHQRST